MSTLEDHEREQEALTGAEGTSKRWYVTLTWDNFPEGGSFGEIIEADTSSEAETECRQRMAAARIGEIDEGTDEEKITDILNTYNSEWELIDCWDVDEFIDQHRRG